MGPGFNVVEFVNCTKGGGLKGFMSGKYDIAEVC